MSTVKSQSVLPEFCWKIMGVGGDSSCEKLKEYGHCRHCSVYSSAGKKLLEREIPHEYREEWKLNLAQAKEERTSDLVSLLVFRIHDEWLALKTIVFHEVAEGKPVHSVPLRSNSKFRGVVNLNGEMLLCVSLSDLLGIARNADADREDPSKRGKNRMVVVGREEGRFIFAVDEISGVCLISGAEINHTPSTISESPIQLVKGVFNLQTLKVGLLDEERLIEAMNRSLQR